MPGEHRPSTRAEIQGPQDTDVLLPRGADRLQQLKEGQPEKMVVKQVNTKTVTKSVPCSFVKPW